MISGIGTDIVEISRFTRLIENTQFLTKHFTEFENQYFVLKNKNPQTVAASFAAKEAFSKALGTGVRGFTLKDVEILHDNLGKPYINVYNRAKELLGGGKVFLSLSHSDEYATAMVVIEKN